VTPVARCAVGSAPAAVLPGINAAIRQDQRDKSPPSRRPHDGQARGVDRGAPPADLVIEDITVGDGPEAKPGQQASVHYVGVSHSTGREFDASWNRGEAFEFPLGGGRVIAGWDQGVVGMRVGGRRRLTIPPHLGYGDRGAGGVIKPGETLVFVVDLLGVR
jgi:peptidylprolyl isomerase